MYLPASRARRNRTQAAQPTQLVDELARRRRRVIVVRAESTDGAPEQGKPRRNHRHFDATAVDQPQY